MQQGVGNNFWQDAIVKYPCLEKFDDLKNNPQYFVAVVKSFHEIDVMETEGDSHLCEYKDPVKIMKLVDEAKSFESFFCEVVEKNEDDLFLNMGIYDDFSACNTFISNDNMIACKSFDALIKNKSGLPEIVQMREKMVTGLSYQLPQYIDYEMDNTRENAVSIQRVVEQDPRGVLALMAISGKNSQEGLSKVKIFSPKDL